MKAIICTKYGSPDVLQLTEIEKPTPKDSEILIKIHATSVTSGDARMRGFNVPSSFKPMMRFVVGFTKPRNPVLGSEFAGEVEAVGKTVTKFKKGDHVFGMTGFSGGGYAEYKTLPESAAVTTKPQNMSFEQAAIIPFGGTTALHFLRKGQIQAGQKVLVYGASGCVGTYAVQLAKYFGAEVTGVCSTPNLEMVQSIGADKVIDYTQTDFTKNGEIYDIIFDTVGKTSFEQCANSLTQTGYYLLGSGELWDMLASIWNKQLIADMAPENAKDLVFLKELIEAGNIKPVIDRCYPLEAIVEAHRYVDTGRKKGSVAITVA